MQGMDGTWQNELMLCFQPGVLVAAEHQVGSEAGVVVATGEVVAGAATVADVAEVVDVLEAEAERGIIDT